MPIQLQFSDFCVKPRPFHWLSRAQKEEANKAFCRGTSSAHHQELQSWHM